MLTKTFNLDTTSNSLYRDDISFDVTVNVDRQIINNTDTWLICYTIDNRRMVVLERYPDRGMHGYPTFCPSQWMAEIIGMDMARREIEDSLKEAMYRDPRNAEERLLTICHRLRHGTAFGRLVNAVYPSMLHKRVRIWVSNYECGRIIEIAMLPLSEGITIEFYQGYPS